MPVPSTVFFYQIVNYLKILSDSFLLQADCDLVKIDIHCHIQGDVVMECINLDSNLEREQMVFRVMFNTAFIRSNILMLNRDEVDRLWNFKEFPKDFRAEVFGLFPFVYLLDSSG